MRHTWVDVAAVRAVAGQFDVAAAAIDAAVRTHLAGLTFDGAAAGRAHTAGGDALRTGLQWLAGDVSQWARAAVEIAVALRAGADRYADAESLVAARVG